MKLLEKISECFYPSDIKCIICDAELRTDTRYMVCEKCNLHLNHSFCNTCGRPLQAFGAVCDNCFNSNLYFQQARSGLIYEDDVKKLIHKFKFYNAKYLANPLSEILADTYYEAKWDIDYVTFVPLHIKRLRKRGYNQAEQLCNAFCELTNLKSCELLQKNTFTKNMAKLDRSGRAELIKGTFDFVAEIDIKGKKIILIDDVLTTGATSNECAKVLKNHGGIVYILTLASVKAKEPLIFQKELTKLNKGSIIKS